MFSNLRRIFAIDGSPEPASSGSAAVEAEIADGISSNPSLIRDATTLNRKSPDDIERSLLSLHPGLLDELECWYEGLRPVDEEDIRYKDSYANLPPPPKLSPSQRRLTEIAAKRFTTEIANKGLCEALNLQVLYSGEPAPEMQEGAGSGGYADIHGIKLSEPRTFVVEVCEEDGSTSEVEWVVSKIAVKRDRILDWKDEEYKYCTRMVREARIWCRMKHRNIAPLLGLWSDFDPSKPLHSFVLPWFEDGDLGAYIKRQKPSVSQKLSFLRDIASALSYMHNHEFRAVHGDLRANNVLVKDGTAYVSDFGLSRLYDTVVGFTRTIDREAGPVNYIAPERFLEETTKATTYSDVYEFGSVVWEVWTEEVPWVNQAAASAIVFTKVSKGERPSIPDDMPSELKDLLRQCWEHDRLARPTMEEVLNSVSSVMKRDGVYAEQST